MIEIKVDGSLHQALKYFKSLCEESGLSKDMRRHRERISPSKERRIRKKKSLRRWQRRERKIKQNLERKEEGKKWKMR
ncbi:30S ribosomal protein S21 [bacterium]|nr:30S ribosomal protein S21 [bacterium]